MDAPSSTPESNSETGEPKKYIRTFAGDMETLQKGGSPELTPLQNATPLERIVAASPVSETPTPAPAVETPIAPPPALAPGPAPLQTYATDFSDHVKETKASPVSVLAAEQDAAPAPTQNPVKASKSNTAFLIAGVVLLIAGGAGAVFAYLHYKNQSAPLVVTQNTIATPIFVDEQEEIQGSGSDLLSTFTLTLARPLEANKVRLIYASSTLSMFAMLPLGAPDVVVRNVRKTGSMAGVVNAGGATSLFFLLSVSSYGETFAGMLAWEPSMPASLAALYPPVAQPSIEATSTPIVATTTATTTKKTTIKSKVTAPVATSTYTVIQKPGFRDEVVGNHDVRIYRDEQGNSLMLYGYWNPTTLIIARDPAAFTEILSRLATTRTL